tara:strand:+ start:86 stop:1090 length:1005 start_codon:yes stop_codon:yes gene_type:complete
MNNLTYISLNCLYFIFCVLLVNTIKKEFYKQTDEKILNINSKEIFIPADRDNIDIYIEKLEKLKIKPKFIYMLNKSNLLTNQNKLWDFLRNKYFHNICYLNNFFLKTYILSNYHDRRFLEQKIYKKNQKYPLKFILTNQKEKKLITLKSHYDFFDLVSIYNENNFNLIREIGDNIFIYQNSVILLENYILISKNNGKINMYMNIFKQFLLLNLSTNKIVRNKNIDILFNKAIFEKQFEKINLEIQEKMEFILKSIKDIFENDKILNECSAFEIFGIRFMIDKEFNVYIFDISRKINLLDKDVISIYSRLIFETYSFIRGEMSIETTNFIPILNN